MSNESVRVATYLPQNIADKLTKKAEDCGLNESAFIRTLIVKALKNEK